MLRRELFIFLLILTASAVSAQQTELLSPVFAPESEGLVFIEGEDAVSTNFAAQPVSNFGTSGYRAVQLNRNTGLQGGASFYAEFVFYIEDAGEYEFWYGGTPPGPRDDLSPSYASPFRYSLDGGEPVDVYREDMKVVEGYSPSYYWNNCGYLSLSEGTHRFRIEVSSQRGYDGRYFFYLDNLFFIDRSRGMPADEVRPEVFPTTLESSEIDSSFLSIADYQNYIDANPDQMPAYIELALVFSLVGDYHSALKTLNKAMGLDASDPYPVVLAAKNRLWKGDVRESLVLYDRALGISPDDKSLWAEAGKVAAWTAEYDKSIDFFTRGLEVFPGDLTMQVNLGLTYLWMARDEDAAGSFRAALDSAKSEPGLLSRLGEIEEAAGYPEYARDVYVESIETYPEYLDFYLLLQSSYLASGERDAAEDVRKRIESTFQPSVQLQNRLDVYSKKLSMRDDVIAAYLQRLREEPDNLELRQELAQTFFWNGMTEEAVNQIKYVITTHSYTAADAFGRRNAELMKLADLTASVLPFFTNFRKTAGELRKEINASANELSRAVKKAESSTTAEAAERAAAEAALAEAGQHFADSLASGRRLAELADSYNELVELYRTGTEEVLNVEKTENEAFRAVVASSGWFWDRSWQTDELGRIREDEPALASFMLGRVLLSLGDYRGASEVLMPPPAAGEVIIESAEDSAEAETGPGVDYGSAELPVLYALFEASLLSGEVPDEKLVNILKTEYPHLGEVFTHLSDSFDPLRENPAGIYYQGMAEEAAEVLKALTDAEAAAGEVGRSVSLLMKQQAAVLNQRLERVNYYLEADTYLIRYELGNYYLEEGRNREASDQFRRVIAVDPWNISAAYKLGVVEQRYGNWSEAMKYYKKVYQQDNTYENVVGYYNQLARAHSDRFGSSAGLTGSPSEISFAASLEYSSEINSLIGLGIRYSLDQQRQYREFTGQEKGSFQMHLLEAGVPVTFGDLSLRVVPESGLYVESIYFKNDYSFPAADSVGFTEFLQTLSTYPKYGVSADWSAGPLSLSAGWENAIEPDTIYADREMVRKNDFFLNANTWFDLEKSDLLGPLTTRTYGRLQLMGDSNIKGQIYQDAQLGINLTANPVIRLSPGASVNFETSKTSPGSGYYAPVGVLEAKGSLRSAFTFPSADWSSAFEAVLWAGCGGYWSGLGTDDADGSLKADGGTGFTWVRNGSSYFLNISALGTFNQGENEYWEISIALGSNLSLPALLTR